MTDNEIIKALECCIIHKCEKCPAKAMFCSESVPMAFAISLIHRQKADIERLNEELNIIRAYIHDNGFEWDLLSYSKRNGR